MEERNDMFRLLIRVPLMVLICLMLTVTVLIARNALPSHAAGASITLSATKGDPTSSLGVKGSGFKGGETIVLSFDTTQVGKKTASKTGTFSTTIIVPSSAVPGKHVVQAKGIISKLYAQATFLVQSEWVQLGFNRQHNYFNVFENVLNPTNVSKLTQSLAIPVSTLYTSPAIVNNIIYVGSVVGTDGQVFAFDATTGSTLWSQTIGADSYSSPAVINNVVYIGTDKGTIYALNAMNGAVLWSISLGSTLTSPTVVNNVIYINSQDGNVYALNATTGTTLWKAILGGGFGISSTTYNNGIIYATSTDINGDSTLYALNATSGAILWSVYLGWNLYYSLPTATVANSVLYITFGTADGAGECAGGYVDALNATTGNQLWETQTNGCNANPAVANNIIYAGDSNGSINALNTTTGKIVWTSTIGDLGSPIDSAPTVANGVIYASDGDLYALNASNGAVLWAHSFGANYCCSPEVLNGVVYFATKDGNLYTFHL